MVSNDVKTKLDLLTWKYINKLVKDRKLGSMFSGDLNFPKAPLVHQPGKNWTYGISADWLRVIVEKVMGKDLEKYMKGHIFVLLNMNDTSYFLNGEGFERLVTAYKMSDEN